MIGGWNRNGSTGEHLPRPPAPSRTAGSPGSSSSASWSCSRVGTLTARLFYLQIANGTQYAALSTRQRTVLEPIPAPRGIDLRPQRAPARGQRPDLRGQGPPGRPARTPCVTRSSTDSPRCSAMDPSEIHGADRRQPGIGVRPRARGPGRRPVDRPADLGGRRRPAGRRGRRRGPPPVHRWCPDVAAARLHGTGLGRAAARPAHEGLPARRPARARPASRRHTRRSSAARTAPRASSATPPAAARRSSRRSRTPSLARR